ncbi:MAG: glycohydrolase toxin TNT-related protein [Bdellovibrionaceae bacterium]|nr:glycohydrolase toxin TNT-related protein [Pseudobdellovibrionaceae bacterium]
MSNRAYRFFSFGKTVLNFGMILVFLLTSCTTLTTKNNKKTDKDILGQQTAVLIENHKPINTENVRSKLEKFKKVLTAGKLTESDWKLHDELLDYYIRLKKQSSTKLIIPPHSRMTRSFEAYCLNSTKAAPQNKEVYHWQKSMPDIPYYKELLKLRRENKITASQTQELLWNLQRKTNWEDYPERSKAILLKIDPKAMLKLPSQIKDQAKNLITNSILGLPGVSEAKSAYSMIEGKYYHFEDLKRSVENLRSSQSLEEYDDLTEIPDTGIYSQSSSNSYAEQEITFYNPTDQVQELDLENYYLSPERTDVQGIGINPHTPKDQSLFSDLEKTLFQTMARLGIGFTPLVNDVADIYELLTGKDFISGNQLSYLDRTLAGVGVIAGSSASYRYAKRAIFSPAEFVDDFAKGLSAISQKAAHLDLKTLANSESALARATTKAESFKNNIGELKESVDLLKRNNVERSSRREVMEAFDQGSKVTTYSKDTKVYRYSLDGVTAERGRWVTPTKVSNPQVELALPNGGSYKVTEWTVPQGTEVIEGLVAPKFGQPGGGRQIFLPDPGVLK